jgi:hypothetical protein
MGVVNYTGAGTPEQLRNGQVRSRLPAFAGIPIRSVASGGRRGRSPNGEHVALEEAGGSGASAAIRPVVGRTCS